MTLFVITFILFAIACILTALTSVKIEQHIFLKHTKLWNSFGYPTDFHWFVPAAQENEYNTASYQLKFFLKSPKCEALGDVKLLRLKELCARFQKVAMVTGFCLIVLGSFNLYAT